MLKKLRGLFLAKASFAASTAPPSTTLRPGRRHEDVELDKLTPFDPDVRHLEELGLVEWRNGRLQATPAGIAVVREGLAR